MLSAQEDTKITFVSTGGSYGSTSYGHDGQQPAYADLAEGGSWKQKSAERATLSFHEVGYWARVGCWKTKIILDSCSGIMPSGLNAIMGATGSGKTSLLDILADRKSRKGVDGTVLVNGQRQPKNFKCMSGYVVQDDVVMGTLSIRENLQFSAALRLPANLNQKQRKQRVEKVIEELGLQDCADTKVGNEFIRGVSGGERKRTNIGMELIIEPQVLFLDEPTTGLDAHTAVSVIRLLKGLTQKEERIIILSIHQPRYSIFKLFDTLTLLSQGSVTYHGPAHKALSYFDSLGYTCESHDNPADFFLDVLTSCEVGESMVMENLSHSSLPKPLRQEVNLVERYKTSESHAATQDELARIMLTLEEKEAHGASKTAKGKYATNFFWQLLVVTTRSAVNLIRNPMTSSLQFVVMVFFSILVGLIYFRLNDKDLTEAAIKAGNPIYDRIGAFFFIVMNQIFGNLSAVDHFIKQRALFIHENVSGFYRVSVYFLSKVSTDIVPMRIIPTAVFCVIVYFMIGLQLEVTKFFIFLLTVVLVSNGAAALAFAISSRVAITAVANLLIALTFVLMMLFGGFLIALDSLPIFLQWLKYLSIFRYAIEALSINEMAGQFYCVSNGTNSTEPCLNGTDYLVNRGYESSNNWIWIDEAALGAFFLIFLFVTYFNLRTIKKVK